MTADGHAGADDGVPNPLRPFLAADLADGEDAVSDPTAATADPPIRPFLMTAGRVLASEHTLAIETQLVVTERGHRLRDTLEYETRRIIELCEAPLSLAELASRLDVPLAVVQVLVHDLAKLRLICIFAPDAAAASRTDVIERVIHGLLTLS